MSKTYPLIVSTGGCVVDMEHGLVTPVSGSAVLNVGGSMIRNGSTPYHGELQYLALLQELIDKHEEDPTPREDRTGTGTFSVFGRQIRFDLSEGFPLLTTKKMFTKGIFAELLWILSGSTNVKPLQDQGVKIWDEWADEDGDLGPVYGKQWRDWETQREGVTFHLDQILGLIETLKSNPTSRRHVISAWNVGDLDQMNLAPCHCLFQFYVEKGKLSCQLYQRSADIFLGVPFNIASYAALTHLIAREVGLEVGDFIHTFGDLHLYANHVQQAKEQVKRDPYPFPIFALGDGQKGLFELQTEDLEIWGYQSHPAIKGHVSV